MAQLEAMGFPTIRCQKALLATGNQDPEAAMEWLFGHMEDPGTLLAIFLRYIVLKEYNWVNVDIDDPIEASPTGPNSGPEPNPEQIAMLADMGFTSAQARKALRETVRELSFVFTLLCNNDTTFGTNSPGMQNVL
jgi:ubiquitin carboxyl-terminal hydrolase 5/13